LSYLIVCCSGGMEGEKDESVIGTEGDAEPNQRKESAMVEEEEQMDTGSEGDVEELVKNADDLLGSPSSATSARLKERDNRLKKKIWYR
jgi:hypothetical protein